MDFHFKLTFQSAAMVRQNVCKVVLRCLAVTGVVALMVIPWMMMDNHALVRHVNFVNE